MNLTEQLKQYEGTKSYQASRGIFRDGKFHVYKDSLNYSTIGYGHLVLKGEDFTGGITEAQADALLQADIKKAQEDVKKLDVQLPKDSRWNDFLVMMIFQVGLTKTLQFKKFLAALRTANYATAINEVKDSNWYRQTPNRVDSMIKYVVG